MKKPKNDYDDDDYVQILGTGAYQRIGDPSGKTKMKAIIGFIRPKQKEAPKPTRKK